MVNEGRDRVARARRRRTFVRVAWCLVVSAIVWNAVLDRQVRSAERRYLDLRLRDHEAVTIRGVMDAAIRHAVLVATGWGSVALAAGIFSDVLFRRRFRKQNPVEAAGASERG